jgi:hypothetical protein
MIIPNLIIGTDRYGHKLQCGDVCLFKIMLQRPKKEEKIEELKGMIVYDESSFAYTFETLDDYAPILCMYCVEHGSIEKLFEANADNFNNIPHGEKWKEIYNKNLMNIK